MNCSAISRARPRSSSQQTQPVTIGGGASVPFSSRNCSRYARMSSATSVQSFCGLIRMPAPTSAMIRTDSGDTAAA